MMRIPLLKPSNFTTTIAFLCAGAGSFSASASRPIEIMSDPYRSGAPTHYTVIRGQTKITYSHPLVGQFTRAEITTRDKNGIRLTRFLLSTDGKNYHPTLQIESPYERHNSNFSGPVCEDTASPLGLVKSLEPKVVDGELIAKKRVELEKSKFFDPSCFDKQISDEHRNAIFNASADVLTIATQNSRPQAKYLQCLEDNGYGVESGTIQGLVKQSLTEIHQNPRITISCTADSNAKPAEFNEKTKVIKIKVRPKPVREDYAVKVFHELLHAAPIRDGAPLQAMEDCCTQAESCEILDAYKKKKQDGERTAAVLDSLSPKLSVLTSEATVLKGSDGDSLLIGRESKKIREYENQSIAVENETPACKIFGPMCKTITTDIILESSQATLCFAVDSKNHAGTRLWLNVILEMANASIECPAKGFSSASADSYLREAGIKLEGKTIAELAETLPQTSPLTWDMVPAEPSATTTETKTPLRLGSREDDATSEKKSKPPLRTIASISPLPDEKPQQRLGSGANRKDVSSGRATLLVDTLEKAAAKVSKTLTPDKVDLLKVDAKAIFKPGYQAKTEKPHYIVMSSTDAPMKVADIGDIKNLSFPNPFADTKPSSPPSTVSTKKQIVQTPNKPRADGSVANNSSPRSPLSEPTTASQAMVITSKPAITAIAASEKERAPAALPLPEFKQMDRGSLIKFMTNSYRDVEPQLNNQAFQAALVKNRIRIVDHEQNKVGSLKPEITFIYDSEKGRLVLNRRDRK